MDKLPQADLLIANLLIEYIGYECFQDVVKVTSPQYVSCIIQINEDSGFVSDSPYLHAFDGLESVHHQMAEQELKNSMDATDLTILYFIMLTCCMKQRVMNENI